MYSGHAILVTVSMLLCRHEKGRGPKQLPPGHAIHHHHQKGASLLWMMKNPFGKLSPEALSSAGHHCTTAADGLEALAVLDSGEEFELLLCNWMMPNLDGMGLLERIQGRFPNMLFILESSSRDFALFRVALQMGAYDYLTKPFEREQLLFLVSRALEYRRLKLESLTYQTNLESLVKSRTEQLQSAMSSLERSYDMTLEGFGDALCLKSRETEGHSRRVTAFTIAIARALGLPASRSPCLREVHSYTTSARWRLRVASCKPGMLDPDEKAIVREHPASRLPYCQEGSVPQRSR